MIGHLRGTILRIVPQLVVLEAGGVGYEVHIPLGTYYDLERRGRGEQASLHIHTHVRDDALLLFGFLDQHEKTLFERLIGISGIGPKLAQAILSGMPPAELAAAIRGGDLRRLNAIPGVGKKTAERLVLELKDRVDDLVGTGGDARRPAASSTAARDAVDALVGLGYRAAQAERAVDAVTGDADDVPVAELVRAALRRIGGG